MANERLQTVFDRTEEIEKWQTQSYDGAEANVSNLIISALYDGLMSFLKAMLEQTKIKQPEHACYPFLERNLAALFFWGRDHGVSRGELDAALQFSHRLRDTVLTLFVSLSDLLSLGSVHLVPSPEKRQVISNASNIDSLTEDARLLLDDPSDTAKHSGDDLMQLCVSMQHIIDCLAVLSSSLEAIADDEFDDEEARALVDLNDRAAHEYFVELISSRFPSASQQIVQALGQANWDRYNHLQRLRDSATEEPDRTIIEKARSEFHDSGIGSSVPSQSVVGNDHSSRRLQLPSDYAATVVSSRAESSHKRLPPLPEDARSGAPFECEVCNRWIQIKRTKEWKKHIFEDVCAYTCIFADCPCARVLFKDREAMTQHLESGHGITDNLTSQTCPLCLQNTTGGRDLICLHFFRHMEEIALGVLPQGAGSEEGSVSSDEGDSEQASHLPSRSEAPEDTPMQTLEQFLLAMERDASCVGDSFDSTCHSLNGNNLQSVLLNHYRQAHEEFRFGWQQHITPEERRGLALQCFTSLRSLQPDAHDQKILQRVLQLETARFDLSQTKDEYEVSVRERLFIMQKLRQQTSEARTPPPPSPQDPHGKMSQQQPIACTVCAKAKTKCDKAVPSCSRCTGKGLQCEPRSTRRISDDGYRKPIKHFIDPERFPVNSSSQIQPDSRSYGLVPGHEHMPDMTATGWIKRPTTATPEPPERFDHYPGASPPVWEDTFYPGSQLASTAGIFKMASYRRNPSGQNESELEDGRTEELSGAGGWFPEAHVTPPSDIVSPPNTMPSTVSRQDTTQRMAKEELSVSKEAPPERYLSRNPYTAELVVPEDQITLLKDPSSEQKESQHFSDQSIGSKKTSIAPYPPAPSSRRLLSPDSNIQLTPGGKTISSDAIPFKILVPGSQPEHREDSASKQDVAYHEERRSETKEEPLRDQETSRDQEFRQRVACTQCRKRRVRCDKKTPCSACCARGASKDCHFPTERIHYAAIQQSDEIQKLRSENLRLKEQLQAHISPKEHDDTEDEGASNNPQSGASASPSLRNLLH